MFNVGQAEGVTQGGASPSATTEVLEDINDVQKTVPIGAGTDSPASNSVTSMSGKMLDKIVTSPENDVAAAVAAGELSADEVHDMCDEGMYGAEAYDAALEAEEIQKAAEEAERAENNSMSAKFSKLFQDAKAKVKSSVPTTREEIKKSSLNDVIKTQDTSAKSYKKNNCANKPYFECSTCQWAKSQIDTDYTLKALAGSFGFLDDYIKAVNKGNTGQADQMLDCPGRKRELMSENGVLGTVTGVSASVTTITATAASGNSKLFGKVSEIASGGDMKAIARREFGTMSGKVVENGSTVANMKTAMTSCGIDSKQISQAALPSALRDSRYADKSITDMVKGSVSSKKLTGFNGMKVSSVTELCSGVGTVNKNQNTAIKQGYAIGVLNGGGKAPSDSHFSKISTMLDKAYAERS